MQTVMQEDGNRLLRSLSKSDRELVAPHLKPVELKFRQRLEGANRRIRTVYFIDRGLGSVVGIGSGQRLQSEVAIIGREGVTGTSVLLGTDRSPHETFMQLEGTGRCITTTDLISVMAKSRSLAACLLRFVHVLTVQIAHTAVANAKGRVDERLARWLLMAHDRIDGNDVRLTHDFLALMLGSRRAGVTIALNKLESENLVANARGCITILDREGLRNTANGLYGAPEEEFARLFPAS
jgi:CRP-like cAMP-binding protein